MRNSPYRDDKYTQPRNEQFYVILKPLTLFQIYLEMSQWVSSSSEEENAYEPGKKFVCGEMGEN
jgi:hypothetical protein